MTTHYRSLLACEQDFYNLVDVYLDAVFFPNCVRDEKTFQQEGWHYEVNSPDEDVTYKGEREPELSLQCCSCYGLTKIVKLTQIRFRESRRSVQWKHLQQLTDTVAPTSCWKLIWAFRFPFFLQVSCSMR